MNCPNIIQSHFLQSSVNKNIGHSIHFVLWADHKPQKTTLTSEFKKEFKLEVVTASILKYY